MMSMTSFLHYHLISIVKVKTLAFVLHLPLFHNVNKRPNWSFLQCYLYPEALHCKNEFMYIIYTIPTQHNQPKIRFPMMIGPE